MASGRYAALCPPEGGAVSFEPAARLSRCLRNGALMARYDSIREKLITAVNDHHVAWNDVPTATLHRIRNALQTHRSVWNTSSDLITYWAIMSSTPPGTGFADAFWHGTFDPADAEPNNPNRTRLWWPHGALHLYRLPDGSTVLAARTPGPS